ncbi:MAG: HU family DNA-binding protein [Psychroflexus sp.]
MISIRRVKKINPMAPEAPQKHYARAIQKGVADLDELAMLSAKQSSLSKADCYGVLIALLDAITYRLREGDKIELGHLGSFRISVSSEGVADEEDFSVAQIKKARILFTPEKDLKHLLNNLEYVRD